MKINLTKFTALLVAGMALVSLALWCLSLIILLDRQNQHSADVSRQNWQSQVLQLQQKQQLWLQSQFYLLNRLVEAPGEQQNFQSFLWDYYQRNPDIWAVNLVHFDWRGNPVSKTTKPGCLQPSQMQKSDFDVQGVPRISSCRIDDKALLEIAGPVLVDNEVAVLLVSMDYFSFLTEFSSLTHRNLQRAADSVEGIQYEEYSPQGKREIPISIPIGDNAGIYGQLHLWQQPITFWQLFKHQAIQVFVILTLMAAIVMLVFYLFLIQPLHRLAEKMHTAASTQQDSEEPGVHELKPGLALMFRYYNALQKIAKRDPVTGLDTRIIFEDRLARAILESKRNARKYALVLVDIHGLEVIAHQHGQYLTDSLLKQVAENLREGLRETDNIARFERNLFALLVEVRERNQLNALVEKIYLSVIRRYVISGREFDISAGMGVSIYPDHAIDANGLYKKASEALLKSDQSEWPIIFSRSPDEITDTSGFTLIQALRRAIEQEALNLVFQPVVDLKTHEPVYFEALLRWKDPNIHDVSIDRTIQLAERNHLIKPLTNWIFESACRFISKSGVYNLVVGINLSMIDLHDRQLPDRIEVFLEKFKVKPSQIVIEITEGQIMQDPAEVIDVLAHLGVMGLSLSIDDFGTGQASLTYLKELPVEKLKIDQSFIRDIAFNPDDQLIVKGTIELAHTLDLKVIAEGVETMDVYDLLRKMGCDYAQGYYISHPLAANQVAAWYEKPVKLAPVQENR